MMNRIDKISAFGSIFLMVVVLAVATFVEKYKGTEFVADNIYGSWWFIAIWVIIAAAGIKWFFHRRQPAYSIALHCSLVLILVGAFLTSITSRHGSVHIRQGEVTDSVTLDSGEHVKMPFSMSLDKFQVDYHPGTMVASDYKSLFTIIDGKEREQGEVAMNQTFTYFGVRLFQTAYDEDMLGSRLTYNEDRIGQPVTYAGYALLFVSMVWMLFAPNGGFRRLLRDPRLRKGLAVIAVAVLSMPVSAVETMSKPAAEAFGSMLIESNGRICPLQTVAIDFTKKLCGKSDYNGYSAEQVFAGFLFYGEDWAKVPIIKVKDAYLREKLGLGKNASVSDFFARGYILGPYVEAYYQGQKNSLNKAAVEIDDKIAMIMSLRQGAWLKMFPVEDSGNIRWFSPVDQLPAATDSVQALFIRRAFGLINEEGIQSRNDDALVGIIGQMKKYQLKYGGNTVPSERKLEAERLYNNLPMTDWLYRIDITSGIVLLLLLIRSMLRSTAEKRGRSLVWKIGLAVLAASFVALTFSIALRSIVSGRLPLGNGYETMLAIAWCVQLLALVLLRKFPFLLSFGLLLSGFFLLVSAIAQMDPQITPLMPVLSSPLLSIHVSLIMIAYALLSFTFICSLIALVLALLKGTRSEKIARRMETLQLVSRMFLYPALTLLAMGIFIGAVWANQSWGRYWGWDPKETWALINFLLYAVAMHDGSLPWLRRPLAYHIYVGLVFLTVLMTYIGVNYFLGGMHSYA